MFGRERFAHMRQRATETTRNTFNGTTDWLRSERGRRTAKMAGGVAASAIAVGIAARAMKKDSPLRTELKDFRRDLSARVTPLVRDSATRMKTIWTDNVAPELRGLRQSVMDEARTLYEERMQRRGGARPTETAKPTQPEKVAEPIREPTPRSV